MSSPDNAPTTATSAAPEKKPFVKGLAGVVAVQTQISHPDGPNSKLIYRGIDIEDLAANATYEEVAYLLLFGNLPSAPELADFNARLVANRWLPQPMYDLLRSLPRDTVPMEALRTAVSTLSFYDPEIEDISIEATQRKAIRLISQLPTLCAAYQRIREKQEPISPNPRLSHAANVIFMLSGIVPEQEQIDALNAYYVLLADHGMNASTFTARVIASTQADLHSAITGAIAALKGPLHGGANEATMNMLLEIGEPANVDEWVDHAFATKRLIMGFGHRVYKNGDPRARVLTRMSEALGKKTGQLKYHGMARQVEQAVLRHREIYPNVDFYSASLLYNIGIPIDLFTPMFACSRVAGWSAHVIEQYMDNALIRPQSEYVGALNQHYIQMKDRPSGKC